MKRTTLILTAAVLGISALAATATLAHSPGQGQGMMQGQGYMHGQDRGYMQGKGKMQGHGYGAGNCLSGQALEKPLTVDDARATLQQRLEDRGNDRLKVGKVTDKDDKTITAEIVTVDDSLVRLIEIDKATGRHTPVR